MSGQIYVISGPSGAGKSTIIRLLIEKTRGLGYSISHTSRAPRGHEINGRDYHFVDRETFSRMIEEGAFVEWAEVYNDLYGTSFSSLSNQTDKGLDVVMDIDPQGARNIRERLEERTLIFIMPPSVEVLEERLRDRATDHEAVIHQRMEKALNELKECLWYDYIIINDDLEEALEKAQAIICTHRCRRSHMLGEIEERFGIS